MSDVDAVRAALRPNTKLVWVETPTNPLLNVGDIAAISEVAQAAGAKLVGDNTFASPYLQQPLQLGADIALHSTTKYIGGHSDVVGGALVTNDEELDTKFAFLQNGAGAVPGPFDAFLTMRGIKTLALRMERHSDNAEKIVDLLTGTPRSLRSSTRASSRIRACRGGQADAPVRRHDLGASEGRPAGRARLLRAHTDLHACRVARRCRVVIEHPGAMTHASTAGSALEVPEDLVRLSLGIEDAADLLADVEQALG